MHFVEIHEKSQDHGHTTQNISKDEQKKMFEETNSIRIELCSMEYL